uniref:Predicted protein n=1 Tax=Physcomitrium patens TaxID=3218 RepID=A9U777_PHYPA
MNRLLIVDDEPIIVDGIYRLLQEEEELQLDLHRAYGGDEALEKLNTIRFDIVLSDIWMPGMTGLELQEHINERWPACKIIFLTGHPDFNYAQTAIRNQCMDYILKTESDETLLRSVRKAIELLQTERMNAGFLDKASEQFQLAVPALQREILQGFCEGTQPLKSLKPELLKSLSIPLTLDGKVMLVMGRVDRWPIQMTKAADKAHMMFAIHNIAKEYLSSCALQSVDVEHNRFFWLIQPKVLLEWGSTYAAAPEDEWSRTIRFVHGTLEMIQSTSLELLKIPLSFAAAKEGVEWREIPARYQKLRAGLSRGLGIGQETILIEGQQSGDFSVDESEIQKQTIRQLIRKWSGNDYVSEEEKQEMYKLLSLLSGMMDPFYEDVGFFLEIYYAIASHLLTQLNRWSVDHAALEEVEMDRVSHYQLHATRKDAFHYLIHAALRLIEARDDEKKEHTNQVVSRLNRYVEEHLDSDLSLTTLSDLVHLNPYYMSRLYKQMTGVNLPDYITDERIKKAKELVVESHLKMHEICKKVGFESPAYFTRIFKKKTGSTPQEFREKHQPTRFK